MPGVWATGGRRKARWSPRLYKLVTPCWWGSPHKRNLDVGLEFGRQFGLNHTKRRLLLQLGFLLVWLLRITFWRSKSIRNKYFLLCQRGLWNETGWNWYPQFSQLFANLLIFSPNLENAWVFWGVFPPECWEIISTKLFLEPNFFVYFLPFCFFFLPVDKFHLSEISVFPKSQNIFFGFFLLAKVWKNIHQCYKMAKKAQLSSVPSSRSVRIPINCNFAYNSTIPGIFTKPPIFLPPPCNENSSEQLRMMFDFWVLNFFPQLKRLLGIRC